MSLLWSSCLLGLIWIARGLDIRRHLGTRAPYPVPHTPAPLNPTGCEPTFLYLLSRHGSRYPTKKLIRRMKEQATKLKDLHSTKPELQWLKEWEVPYDVREEGQLSAVGAEEMYQWQAAYTGRLCQLGRRYRSRFPSIFDVPYKPYLYEIQTTKKARAAQSGTAFAFGVWEGHGTLGKSRYLPVYQYSHELERDRVLYPHKNCPAYRRWSKLDNSTQEAQLWLEKKETRLRKLLETALGASSADFTESDVRTLFELCGFELAVANTTAQFCSIFRDQELVDLIEYGEDLKVLGVKLYGDEPSDSINWRMGTRTLAYMVAAVDDVITGESHFKASLNFAHAETVAPMIGLLELFEDLVPLRHDSPPGVVTDRRFRASKALPFAANVALLLLNCGGEWKVQLLHNEEPVAQPRCNGLTLCPWDAFKAGQADHLAIDYESLCHIAPPSDQPPSCPAK